MPNAERDKPTPRPDEHLGTEVLHAWQLLSDQEQLSLAFRIAQDVLHGAQGQEFAELLSLLMVTLDTPVTTTTRATNNGVNLLDTASRERLPLPFTPEGEADDALAQVRLVQPDGRRAWYISAFDGHDLCFGMIVETDITWDYFSLAELAAIQGSDGSPVQQDQTFTPITLHELETRHQQLTTVEDNGLD